VSDVVKVSTLPPKLAEACSAAMHVCPHCAKPVKFNESIMCQSGMLVYHATCFYRRVQQ